MLTYGNHRTPLSPRNAAIIAAREARQYALSSSHAPHPRDVRLATLREKEAMELQRARIEASPVVAHAMTDEAHGLRCDRVMAYLCAISASGDALPTNVVIGDAVGIDASRVGACIQSLCNRRLLKRVSNRHWRVIEITETGALLRSVEAPAEAMPI